MELQQIKDKFIEIYGGTEDDLRVFASPGRVNLIGEHTDYNGGFVFPAALTMKTTIVARKRQDKIVNMAATDLPDRVSINTDDINAYKDLWWGNYQAGIIAEMQKKGYEIVGCDMLYDDTTPHGGGLSSSAAIEVATALTFAVFSNEAKNIDTPVNMIEMAKISQMAEHNYVGVNCGIMDQFASAMGQENKVIFLNCKDLSYDLVPIKMDGYKIVVTNTNKKRSLADSKYNERRSQCETGLEILKTAMPDKTCLGDISVSEFEKHKDLIKDEIIKNRVQHVVYEDDRVLKSVESLKNNDIFAFGQYMIQSHNSLRDLYEVTGVELDTLVEEALKVDGVIGSRMTGAGFGGCTVSIIRDDAVDNYINCCKTAYTEKIGYEPSFYITEIGNGGHEIL
ncbi:MAG: galactokinase [Clostridia bacterium]|nr:galactokinase [Clostridia bacterium]